MSSVAPARQYSSTTATSVDALSVEQCVEHICEQGCRFVSQVLQSENSAELVSELATLSPAERQLVMTELESIMSVYAHSGGCTV